MRNWAIIQELLEAISLNNKLTVVYTARNKENKRIGITYIPCAKNIHDHSKRSTTLDLWQPKTTYPDEEIWTQVGFLYEIKALKDTTITRSTRDESYFYNWYPDDKGDLGYWEDEEIKGLFHYNTLETHITWLGANLLDVLNYFQTKMDLNDLTIVHKEFSEMLAKVHLPKMPKKIYETIKP